MSELTLLEDTAQRDTRFVQVEMQANTLHRETPEGAFWWK